MNNICTIKTLGHCSGYHGPHPCDACISDGNRDDPSFAYCGYPAGHAGEHGHWII